MIEHELNVKERIAFLNGVMEGIILYAIWKDGTQVVGCMQKPLKEVLTPYKEEVARLSPNLSHE